MASGVVSGSTASRGQTVVLGAGAVLLTLGVLLGWQSWSERSAPPLDDQLPYLDISGGEPVQVDPDSAVADTNQSPAAVGAPVTITEASAAVIPSAADVVVHVAGAVAEPGVVSLPAGSRVYQAIDLAGGASADADLDRVNLAAPVFDGERIHVPEVGEEIVPVDSSPPLSSTGLSTVPSPIDVNLAEGAELETLRGIGPSLAQAIVTTRVQRGPFRSIDELLEVPGIGEAKLDQIRDQVTVE